MARKQKQILDTEGNDVRDLGYYSTPTEVSHFIQKSMMDINPEIKSVLDPAVGREELLDIFIELDDIKIDSFDIINLKDHYDSNFKKLDFIEYVIKHMGGDLFTRNEFEHDAIIMNPPYNCHEINYIRDNKDRLTEYFRETKALNMYSMFMDSVISNSKDGAVLGMIVSDSFMTNIMHKALREKIRYQCKIHKIILCPTELFKSQKADVRTCILILEKCRNKSEDYDIKFLQRLENLNDFFQSLEREDFSICKESELFLSSDRDNNEIIIEVPQEVRRLFDNKRLGEMYPCVTGISTGDDKKYLSTSKSDDFPHPFYKNPASKKFVCEPQNYLVRNYLKISESEKTFMVRNKRFIGQKGITCSSMGVKFSACVLPEGSTFGVNPNIFPPIEDIGWLCCYLNSSLVQYLLRGIIVRSNMVTSGYVSRIPLINISHSHKEKLNEIYLSAVGGEIDTKTLIEEIDRIIYEVCDFDRLTINAIDNFCYLVYKNT